MARKKKERTEELAQETMAEMTEMPSADQGASSPAEAESSQEEASAEDGGKTKKRDPQEYHRLMNRLRRIEGQVRGIQRMLEQDSYCTDIMIQVAAVNAALNGFNKELLAGHMRTCVAEDIRQGKDETMEELVAVVGKLMR